jgi:hypothetical protein
MRNVSLGGGADGDLVVDDAFVTPALSQAEASRVMAVIGWKSLAPNGRFHMEKLGKCP